MPAPPSRLPRGRYLVGPIRLDRAVIDTRPENQVAIENWLLRQRNTQGNNIAMRLAQDGCTTQNYDEAGDASGCRVGAIYLWPGNAARPLGPPSPFPAKRAAKCS